jgi:hypothetical protein
VHDHVVRVSYLCNQRGMPQMSWKLRTPVSIALAEQLENLSCSRGCSVDVGYQATECSGMMTPSPAPTNGNTTSVMRCARTDPQGVPECSAR